MKRVYKRIRKTHPPSYASKFKESSRDKLQSRGRKYVAYNPFLAFHRSLSASYYRLHWIQKSEGWIIIAGNVNSTMAETLASATPLFERSPIVDVAVQRRRRRSETRRGRWPPRWPNKESKSNGETIPCFVYSGRPEEWVHRGIQSKDNRSIESVEVRKTQGPRAVPRWFDQSNRVSESWFASLSIILNAWEGCWSRRWIIPVGYSRFRFIVWIEIIFGLRNRIEIDLGDNFGTKKY